MTKSIFTKAVHAGERMPQPDFGSVGSPIYPAVAYTYDSIDTVDQIFAGERAGYVYRRHANPTVQAFEQAVAALEDGATALATASGMAAIYGALWVALDMAPQNNRHIVAAQDIYGATYSLITNQLANMGVTCTFADFTDMEKLQAVVTETRPAVLICETASNPLLRLVNVQAVANIAHQIEATLIVDNTFSTPYLCQPLNLGADFVVHSATKYLGGHDDVLAGVVVTSAERYQVMLELHRALGANLSPFDAWLGLRGIKTLALRMRQHCENAIAVANWLSTHPRINQVYYPGLPDHPQHALATQLYQGLGFGGMLSFEIEGAEQESIFRFMESLSLIQPATTLGDVYSLILYPVMSSHRSLTPEERQAVGIGDNLLRLSVGIENVADIIADLKQALA